MSHLTTYVFFVAAKIACDQFETLVPK